MKKEVYVDDKKVFETNNTKEARRVFDRLATATISGKTNIKTIILATPKKILDGFVR